MDSLYTHQNCKTYNAEMFPVKGRTNLAGMNATKKSRLCRIEERRSLSRFMIQTEGKRPSDMPSGPPLHQGIYARYSLIRQGSSIESAVAISFVQGKIRG